jgi:TolB-like protein
MGGGSEDRDEKAAHAPDSGVMGDLWVRVREHKIVQWGLAYLGVALALAHGQELVAQAFGWPELVGRALISLLVVGFPVALTLAWYHGHRGLRRFTAGEATIIALLLLIGAGLLTILVHGPEKSEAVTAQAVAIKAAATPAPLNTKAIAVLPFDNMSGDAGQDYFCDGISEEIMDALVRLPGMKVIGRTSSFAFKGKNADLRTIGEKLGVANLVQGSVRREGNRVRIDVQLVHAGDGTEVWSQSFDRNLSDILKLQDDIAQAVAQKLSGGAEAATGPAQTAATTNGPAYGKYLEGKTLFDKGDIDSMNSGIKALEEAVALDPGLAPAWAELAKAYGFQYLYDKNLTFAQASARVAAARSRALALDPDSVTALLAVPGNAEMRYRWIAYDALVRKVLAANPNNIEALIAYVNLLVESGRMRAALPYAKQVYSLDPLSSRAAGFNGYLLYLTGQRAEGKALVDQALALNPMDFIPRFLREGIELGEGNMAAAVADARFLLQHGAYNEAERKFGGQVIALALAGDKKGLAALIAQSLAPAHAGTLRTDWLDLDRWAMAAGDAKLAAAAMLEETTRPENRFSLLWRWTPLFAPARAQPDFKTVIEMQKLPDYWRSRGWADVCAPVGANDFACH